MAALPNQLTNFIGRRSTIELVGRRLSAHRLVSLVGPGGCGKTRLAIEVGHQDVPARPGTICFVDLSGLSKSALVPDAVRSNLGLAELRGRPALGALAEQLSDHHLLLLLDNCEHLIEGCAALVHLLLRDCPGVRVLATSRERLGVPGEVVVSVGGLSLPERPATGARSSLERSEAGTLFIERARLDRADFSLTEDEALAVASICERLDGIPLAVELAAARASMMSVDAIARELSDGFRVLAGTGRTVPARHKTLLASIEWSCNLLTDDERALLHRLAVFTPGFTFAGAEAVCADEEVERAHVFGLLTSLVEKSLVQALPKQDRFRLHETMRDYCAGALDACGASSHWRDRHLDYFTELAKTVGPKHWTNDLAGSLRTLDADLDNVRSALDWSVQSKQLHRGAQLMGAVGALFYTRGLRVEALSRCRQLLAAELRQQERAEVLYWAAQCSAELDPASSLHLAEELTALGRSLGDQTVLARGLTLEAVVHSLSEPERTITILDEALPLARGLGQYDLVALGLVHKSGVYKWLSRHRDAVAAAEEALRVAESAGWAWGAMGARAQLALVAIWAGQLQRALDEADVVLRFAEEQSFPILTVLAEIVRCEVGYHRADHDAPVAAERARAAALATGDLFSMTAAEAVKGKAMVWLGQVDEGYEVLERACTKTSVTLGVTGAHVGIQAELVESALYRGDVPSAKRLFAQFLSRAPSGQQPAAVPRLRVEARFARVEGEPQRAHGLACDALRLAYDAGSLLFAIELLELVALTLADLGRPYEAVRLVGAAERQRDVTGYVRPVPAGAELVPVLAELQANLGQDFFEQSMGEGRALAFDQAVEYAGRGRGSRTRPRFGWESLTQSEKRVVSLVGQHLTNAEIAERLFISIPTVKSHLSSVFDKLGVSNRGQLAAQAQRHEARRDLEG